MKRSRKWMIAMLCGSVLGCGIPAYSQANAADTTAEEGNGIDALASLAYLNLLEGDTARDEQNWVAALKAYEDALTGYNQIREQAPDYKTTIMKFRAEYCGRMIADVSGKAANQPVSPAEVVDNEDEGYKEKYETLLDSARNLAAKAKTMQEEISKLKDAGAQNDRLKIQVDELTRELSARPGSDEVGKLLVQRRDLENQVAELNSALKEAARQQAAGGEWQAAHARLEAANTALAREYELSQERAAQLTEQLNAALADTSAADQLNAMTATITNLEAKSRHLEQQLQEAQAASATANESQKEQFAALVESMQQEQATLQQRLENSEKQVLHLQAGQAQAGSMAEQAERLQADLSRAETLISGLQASLKEAQNHAVSSSKELEGAVANYQMKLEAAERKATITESASSQRETELLREIKSLENRISNAASDASSKANTLLREQEALQNRLSAAEQAAARIPQLEASLAAATAKAGSIASLNKRIAELTAQNEAFATSTQALEQKIAVMANEATASASLQSELEQALTEAAKVKDLEAQIVALSEQSKEIASLKTQLGQATAEAAKVKDLEAQIVALSEQSKEIASLKTQLGQATAEAAKVKDLEAKVAGLSAQSTELAALKEQLTNAQADAARAESLNEKLAELATEKDQLETRLLTARAALDTAASSSEQLEARIRDLVRKQKAASQNSGAAESKLGAMRDQIQTLREEKKALAAGHRKAAEAAASLEADNNALKEQLAGTKGELETVAGTAAELQRTQKALEESHALLQNVRTEKATNEQSMQAKLSDLRAEVQILKQTQDAENQRRKSAFATLQSELAATEQGRAEALEQLAIRSEQIQQLQGQLASAEREADLANKQAGDASSALEMLKSDGATALDAAKLQLVQAHEQDLLTLQSELEMLSNKNAQLVLAVDDEKRKTQEVEQRLGEATGSFDASQEQVSRLNAELAAANERLVEVQAEAKAAQAIVSELEASSVSASLHAEVQAQLAQKHAELEQQKGEATVISTQREAAEADVVRLQAALATVESDHEDLVLAYDEQTNTVSILNAQVAELEESVADLEAQAARLDEFQTKLMEESEAHKQARSNLVRLKEHIQEQRAETASLEREQQRLSEELQSMIAQNTQLKHFEADSIAAQYSVDEMRAYEEQMKADLARLKAFVAKVAEEDGVRQREYDAMAAELTRHQKQIPVYTNQVGILSTDLDAAERQVADLTRQLFGATNRVDQLEKVEVAFTDNQQQFQVLESQYIELAEAYQELQRAYVISTNGFADMQASLGMTQNELSTTSQQKLSLQERLEQASTMVAEMKGELDTNRDAVVAAQEIREQALALEQLSRKLETENHNLTDRVALLQSEMQSNAQELDDLRKERDRLADRVARHDEVKDKAVLKVTTKLEKAQEELKGRRKTADSINEATQQLTSENQVLQEKLSETNQKLLEAEARIQSLNEQQDEIVNRLRRLLGHAN